MQEGWVREVEGGIGVGCLPMVSDSLGGTLSSCVDSEATGLERAGKEGIHVGPCLSR
jgi:hypothetical protein